MRGHIPPLPWLEKALEPSACTGEWSRLPGQGRGTATFLPVPRTGCPGVQGTVPSLVPHSPQGSQKCCRFVQALEMSLAPGSWKRTCLEGTGMAPALCSIAGLYPWKSAARRGKVCKRLMVNLLPPGTQCPTPWGCFGRGNPHKPPASDMDQEQALKQHRPYQLPEQSGWEVWKDLVQSNHFANQGKLIKEALLSKLFQFVWEEVTPAQPVALYLVKV